MRRYGLTLMITMMPHVLHAASSYGDSIYGKSMLPERQAAAPASTGQQPQLAKNQRMFSSGTGFFVSNRGHIITNAHVVKGCRDVSVRGAVPKATGKVLALDEEHDLALIQTQTMPPSVAVISQAEYRINPGDQVTVIGYPQEHGVTGLYDVKQARVTDLKGPLNEPHWIQFSDSAQQGNSGGPLLDASGYVIGVVTGKAQRIQSVAGGREEIVSQSDVAVSLPVLKKFMETQKVYFRASTPGARLSSSRIENKASNFIVNIHCDITPDPSDPAQIVRERMAPPPGYREPDAKH